MRKTRADIEAEITALQAELAAIPPETLKLPYNGDDQEGFEFERTAIWYCPPRGGNYLCKTFGRDQFESLRDWLVYHFPKENN